MTKKMETKYDNINPSHYKFKNGMETIDYMEAVLGREGFIGFLTGNSIKYLSRYKNKGGVEDLKKSVWYTERAIKVLENDKDNV